jgi:hypothetical protein
MRWVGVITLSLRRGGQAGPAVVSDQMTKHCNSWHTTPIISYSILTCCAWCCCFGSCCRKKVFECGQTIRQPRESSTAEVLAHVIPQLHAPQLGAPRLTQELPQNGCQDFDRTRCTPIHDCCSEETVPVCVPGMGASKSEATAILGICRMYVHDILGKQLRLGIEG